MRVTLNLTTDEADVVHTALLHTRREYLSTPDRLVLGRLTNALAAFEAPAKYPSRARLPKSVRQIHVSNSNVTLNF